MPSESTLYSRHKTINYNSTLRELNKINSELFGGHLNIVTEKDYIGILFNFSRRISIWINQDYKKYDWSTYNDETDECDYELIEGEYLEVSRGYGAIILNWLEDVILKELGNRLNATIDNDYWMDMDRPKEYSYGTLRERVMKPFPKEVGSLRKMFGLRGYIEEEKHSCQITVGEDLFKICWNYK